MIATMKIFSVSEQPIYQGLETQKTTSVVWILVVFFHLLIELFAFS